ncbi:recombinase family protein [Gloeocapsa sp. PCC 73106]|uniref:recombinase family protein n=1 Tax=Gloeocapsa sp. PCC 73106 TaxID=102232 RepID=UPI0002AC6509|nr:recombinase family protein [Gloeocapsa sp. PCC 73106]ELS00105.1 site-specific recombinase, DNA invertase Pin [Gloeocapsa sp. PCC 73106]
MTTIAYSYLDPLLDNISELEKWDVDRIYQDLGKREQLEQLLLDCQSNPPQRLLVRSLVELGDSLTEISDRLTQLEGLGIEVIALAQDYQSSPIKANLVQLLTAIQTNLNSRRLRQGHARNRIQALPPPGKPPYGYRRGQDRYLIDRATAPVVKDFFEHFLLYGNLRQGVRYLAKKYGKKIAVSTGRHWLTNPVYRGHLGGSQGKIILNTHAPILSPGEAAQIDRLLRRNASLPPRTASASRSLAGLVVCQECHSSMTITRVTQRYNKIEYLYLRPVNCPRQPKCKAIAYSEILKATIERICLDLPSAVSKLETTGLIEFKTTLDAQISQKQAIIEQIPTLETEGIFDEQSAQIRIYQLKTEIAALNDQVAQLPPINLQAIANTVSLPEFWFDLSEVERRFYFREFIQQITIIRLNCDSNLWKVELLFIF